MVIGDGVITPAISGMIMLIIDVFEVVLDKRQICLLLTNFHRGIIRLLSCRIISPDFYLLKFKYFTLWHFYFSVRNISVNDFYFNIFWSLCYL